MKKSRELRQELGELADKFRKLIDVGREKRSADENTQMDRLEKDIETTEKEITRVEAQEKREKEFADSGENEKRALREDPDKDKGKTTDPKELRAQRAGAFRQRWDHLKGTLAGVAANLADAITGELRDSDGKEVPGMELRSTPEYRKAFIRYAQFGKSELTDAERRALAMGTAAAGGFAVPLEDFAMKLIVRLTELNVIRGLASKDTVTQAQSLGIASIANDPADADWTIELGTGNEDATMTFGRRELRPWPLAKRLKASEKFLRASPLGAESIIRERLAIIVGRAHSKAFNTGDGVNKPLGIYTPSVDGIPLAQDSEIGDGASGNSADNFISSFYKLRPVYLPTARFHFHQNWLAKIRALKTANPIAYLWQPGLALGAPSTLMGIPYSIDEYAPSVTAHGAGVYAAVVGDFSYYQIVDALDMRIQRLDELYAETGQVGFIIRAETDAQPLLSEAFIRMIAAT